MTLCSALDAPEKLAANSGMVDMWLAVGPVDELAQAVATIIIDDPVENPKWIAKWQARPKELLAEPARCLLTRDDVMDGVPEMLADVQVEATFPDGTKLVTVHHPIP